MLIHSPPPRKSCMCEGGIGVQGSLDSCACLEAAVRSDGTRRAHVASLTLGVSLVCSRVYQFSHSGAGGACQGPGETHAPSALVLSRFRRGNSARVGVKNVLGLFRQMRLAWLDRKTRPRTNAWSSNSEPPAAAGGFDPNAGQVRPPSGPIVGHSWADVGRNCGAFGRIRAKRCVSCRTRVCVDISSDAVVAQVAHATHHGPSSNSLDQLRCKRAANERGPPGSPCPAMQPPRFPLPGADASGHPAQ